MIRPAGNVYPIRPLSPARTTVIGLIHLRDGAVGHYVCGGPPADASRRRVSSDTGETRVARVTCRVCLERALFREMAVTEEIREQLNAIVLTDAVQALPNVIDRRTA